MENTKTTTPSSLADRIASAIAATEPRTRARNKALASVRWAFRSSTGGYIALGSSLASPPFLVEKIEDATIYDGRDNEEFKLGFFQAITGWELSVEVLEAK